MLQEKDFFLSELFSAEDGTIETPINFVNGEQREDVVARMKNPAKVAEILGIIYDEFAAAGFNIKKEIIENPQDKNSPLAYFFAIERPVVGYEINIDPLTIEADQIEIALAFLEIKNKRSADEIEQKNFVFSEIIGSISAGELEKIRREKHEIFCDEIIAGKFDKIDEV
jgi:hypothetical protein